MTLPRRFYLSLPLLLVVALGCSNSKTPSKVSGKVTYKGQPVSAGTITFHMKEGGVYAFTLKPDGSYSGAGLPAEEMIVTVETESANPDKAAGPVYGHQGKGGTDQVSDYRKMMEKRGAVPKEDASEKGKYVEIPKKYAEKDKSPLRVTLTKGNNDNDFKLED